MERKVNTTQITIGVVGLGLMGSSIVVSLLLAGHPVVALAPVKGEEKDAAMRIRVLLEHCARNGLTNKSVENYLSSLTISTDYRDLEDCRLVLECVLEEIDIKKAVYKKITKVVSHEIIIASNTSAIPISELQQYVIHPERFIGMHWAEPAFNTRFMEIIRGDKTAAEVSEWVYKLAYYWGKEPTLLKKDMKGFITNRLMYAVSREALSLIEGGVISVEDADKCFRYDFGSWITLMGIFRRMDFLGLKDYKVIFDTIFPALDNREDVPEIMQRMVEIHARGTQNCYGLYHYTAEEAREWDDAFAVFNKDIAHLAALYPSEVSDPHLNIQDQNSAKK